MQEILNLIVFNNKVSDYLLVIVIDFVIFTVLFAVRYFIVRKIENIFQKNNMEKTKNLTDIMVRKLFPLALFLVFALSLEFLKIPPGIIQIVRTISIVLAIIIAFSSFNSVLVYLIEKNWKKRFENSNIKSSLKLFSFIIKLALWIVAAVIILDNLGIKISGLLAGLGIGGVAMALASQAILGDLFSFISIFFDKPFEIGDFIVIGEFMGTVENIGIKSTRIRSLNGEELILSNSDLTNSRIRNFKRMNERRVLFNIGVIYETETEKLKKIPQMIEEIIHKIPDTRFDRTHFSNFADFSLQFQIVYYVLNNDYNLYMDIQQEINFRMMEEFAAEGIQFAYPTRVVYNKSQ